jgi:hypothetical protein
LLLVSPPPSQDRIVRLNDDQVAFQPLVTRPDAVYIDPQSTYFGKAEPQEKQELVAQEQHTQTRIRSAERNKLESEYLYNQYKKLFNEHSRSGIIYPKSAPAAFAAKADSSAMMVIAILGIFFWPSTFISVS